VAHEVSSFAQFAEADLLVLGRGAHGHERLRAHAYGIIRQAPCPVLSV
jgi:nucleotide-binding universal stress UspA family protein